MSAPSVLKSEEPYRVIPSEIESIEVQEETPSRGTVEQKKILKSSGDIGQSVSDLLPSEQPTHEQRETYTHHYYSLHHCLAVFFLFHFFPQVNWAYD